MDRSQLSSKALPELREIASALELRGYQRLRKAELIDVIVDGKGGGGNGSGKSSSSEADKTSEKASDGPKGSDSDDAPKARSKSERSSGGDSSERSSGGDSQKSDDRGGDQDSGRERSRERTRSRGGNSGNSGSNDDDGDDRGGSSRNRNDGDDRGRGKDSGGGKGDDQQQGRDRGGNDRGNRNDNQGGNRNDNQGGGRDNQGRNRNKRDRNRRKGGGGGGGGGNQGGNQGGNNRNDRNDRYDKNDGPVSASEDMGDAEIREGVLDLLPEGYGFLRTSGFLSGNTDVYISQSFVRRYNLRRGDVLAGPIRRNKNNDKFPALARVDTIEGEPVEENSSRKRTEFKDLTPLFPQERLRLEVGESGSVAMRIVDLIAPIGKGQRGLVVSPPKAGKTTILKQLAKAIESNNPEVVLMVALVDERPEEVTDFQRSTAGTVIASTFDRPAEDHTQVAELCIERAKRLVERGHDVVILLDSITRLARAYNLAAPASGRILSGGVDSAALYPPKRFFGAARNIEGGGSLTIIATALVETGSKMDEVIFEEFKGTGNMELRLDRRMEQKRIFPAVDIEASGTRKEELLMSEAELSSVWKLRRVLHSLDSGASLELLIDKLKTTKTNEQFLAVISKSNLQ